LQQSSARLLACCNLRLIKKEQFYRTRRDDKSVLKIRRVGRWVEVRVGRYQLDSSALRIDCHRTRAYLGRDARNAQKCVDIPFFD
jgi:hypothetical protein